MRQKLFLINLVILTLLAPCFLSEASANQGKTGEWSKPVSLSSRMQHSWFPDIAIDGQGNVHVVFLGSDFYDLKDSEIWEKYDKVYYQPISTDGVPQEGGPFNIAISNYGVVPRASVAIDNKQGLIHLLFRSKGSLFYQRASISGATTPQSWTEPRNVDDYATSYYSDLVVDQQGTIHAIWTEVKGKDLTDMRQVVVYRQSKDLGISWSFPKVIAQPKYGATRPVLKLDNNSGLHVSWDDGYDNQTARYNAALGGYTSSLDGGKTWSTPLTIGSEKEPVAQTVVTPFGETGVMLVWRVLEAQRIDYMVSNDRGTNWSATASIPNQTARRFGAEHFFDRYYLAADGNGRVHLANVAQTESGKKGVIEKAEDLAIYHNVWQDGKWQTPELVGRVPGFAEYPRIAIGPDRLHIVWFIRDKPVDDEAKSIWYSSKPYDSGLKAQPVGTYVPAPKTTPEKTQAAISSTPVAVLPPIEASSPRAWLEDGYMMAVFSIVPVLLLAVAAGIITVTRRSNKKS
jgi:hypothetical protein